MKVSVGIGSQNAESIFRDPREVRQPSPCGIERRKCAFSDSEYWYLRKQTLVAGRSSCEPAHEHRVKNGQPA